MTRRFLRQDILWILILGINFPLQAQDKEIEEFEKQVEEKITRRIVEEAKKEAEGLPLTPGIMVICEFIEVEMKDFSDWLLENPIKTDATPLRKAVQTWVTGEKAAIVETLVVSARSGERAKVEAVEEHIYPTEYDPPEGFKLLEDGGEIIDIMPPVGIAFETRHVGATLEVDPVLQQDGTVDLNLAPEIVIADEDAEIISSAGDKKTVMTVPRFHLTKAVTRINLHPGDYGLVGTSRLGIPKLPDAKDPIILIFARCDVSGN